MLNVTINGGVSASTGHAPTLTSATTETAPKNRADTILVSDDWMAPERILMNWQPTDLNGASELAKLEICAGSVAVLAESTVFHFEEHQRVLGPEYFGTLQSLADQVAQCPDTTLKILPAGSSDTDNQERVASVLNLLERRGFDLSQFSASSPDEALQPDLGGISQIKFAIAESF